MSTKSDRIDETEVLKLAEMHCKNTEIAAFFDVDVKTITRHFGKLLTKGRERGKASLRKMQWDAAKKGNVTMQIWLGKQYLGQMDQTHEQQDTTLTIKHEYAKKEK